MYTHTLTLLPSFQWVFFRVSPKRAVAQRQPAKEPGKKKPWLPKLLQLMFLALLVIFILMNLNNSSKDQLKLKENQKDYYTLLEEVKSDPGLAILFKYRMALHRAVEKDTDTVASRILDEVRTSKVFFANNQAGLQAFNPFPDKGRLVICGHKEAAEKFKEGIEVYHPRIKPVLGRAADGVTRVKDGHIFVPWLQYAFLEPIRQDNINNL